jgi:hypothetical protein
MNKSLLLLLKVVLVLVILGVAGYLLYPYLQDYLAGPEPAQAKTVSQIDTLYAKVTALKAEVADTQYTEYLALADAQLSTLKVLNASLMHSTEQALIASKGIDCEKDYSSIQSILQAANSTKKSAISTINSYINTNPNSTANLLLITLNNIDTEGMYLFGDLIIDEQNTMCLIDTTPAKTYTLPLNEDEATNLVVDEIVKEGDWFVYSVGAALPKGTLVSVRSTYGQINRTLETETWFFMLDSTPAAHFAHPVKFVYIDAATGDYSVTDELFNPVIDNIDYWYSIESRLNDAWIVYPENPVFDKNITVNLSESDPFQNGLLYVFPLAVASPPAGTLCTEIDCCEGVGSDKGLIMTGNDQSFFHTDTQNMYEHMKGKMDMSAGDITYLTAKAGVPESDGITTLESFKKAIEDLAKDTECCDRVFIYMTGHGINVTFWKFKDKKTGEIALFNRAATIAVNKTKYEYTGYVQRHHNIDVNPYKEEAKPGGGKVETGSKKGGEMWADEIGVLLDKIKSCYVTVMYDSCHAGYAVPWLAGKGRTIITTSNKGSSYVYPKSGPDKKSPGGIFNTLYIMAYGVFKDSADANNDGSITPKEAYDYANKYTDDVSKAHHNKAQKGTYTPPKPPCVCCDVVCNESTSYLCTVIEGNGTIDPLCKKVGDYCGPTTTGIDDNITLPNITENITENWTPETGDGITVGGGGEGIPVVCGDGNKSATEECETDKDCPQYRYCEKCACKQYPMICGDGNIAAGEDCDPKATPTGCSEGLECSGDCVCTEPINYCGDGILSPLEECDVGIGCDSGETCNLGSCTCEKTPTEPPPTEGYCGDGTVQSNEQCESSSQCSSNQVCSNCQCIDVTVEYCGDGEVNGGEECDPNASPDGCYGSAVCSGGCTCVNPPNLDCESICSYTSGAQSFGGGTGSSQECSSTVSNYYMPGKDCYTTCTYSWYYAVSNIAGTSSCCCGMKKEFPCTNCPCVKPCDPGCPDPESTCAANAPSWYVPPS